MPAPVLSSFAQALYDSMAPVAQNDAAYNWALAQYCASIGTMFQEIEDLSRDSGDLPGWSAIMDINRVANKGLGYLAQFVGVRLLAGLDDATQRARILETDGWNRGTLTAISGAAHQFLTGAKSVIIRERDAAASPTDPAYGLSVVTYASETPDSDKVLAALLAQKPAGILLRYQVLTGQDYQALLDNHPTYSNVFSTYATYQGVATETPGT